MGNVDRDIGRYSGRYSGRQSVDSRSILGRHPVDTRSIQRSIVGRQSVDTRSRHGRQSFQMCFGRYTFSFTDTSPTLRRLFADTSPIVGRYLTDALVSNWSTLGRWSVDTWSIVRRQPFDISVESRPIVDRYIGRDFCRSVWFLVRYQQPWRRNWSKITEI